MEGSGTRKKVEEDFCGWRKKADEEFCGRWIDRKQTLRRKKMQVSGKETQMWGESRSGFLAGWLRNETK